MRKESQKNRIAEIFPAISWSLVLLLAIAGLLLGCEQALAEVTDKSDALVSRLDLDNESSLDPGMDGGVDSGTEDYVWIEKEKFLPTEGIEGSYYGLGISISGDTAVVGAPGDYEAGKYSGAAYVYVRTDKGWILQQKLFASDATPGALFGYSAAIDGETIAVGAFQDVEEGVMAGSVYIFERAKDTWQEQQKLWPDDGEEEDEFGISVALDGDTLAVGCDRDDDNADDSGSAYVYVRIKDTWIFEQKILPSDGETEDAFGMNISLSGDTLLVGAPLDDDMEEDAGSAYVFVRSKGTWQEQEKLMPTDGAIEDNYGISLAVNGDDALVGSPLNDEGGYETGAVYSYVRIGDSWTMNQKLIPAGAGSPAYFGRAVSMDTERALIGALIDTNGIDLTGSAYIYELSEDTWTEGQKLLASDGAYKDLFGISVSIDNDFAVIGSLLNNESGADSGAAYLFEYSEPLGLGETCSIDLQCQSGFCVDGVCCEEECGGNESLDCQACSVAAGAEEDGVCGDLDGTICDDGDPETFDDFCNMGVCEGTVISPDSDSDNDSDSDSDTDTDTTDEPMDDPVRSDSCGCSKVGEKKNSRLMWLLMTLLQQGGQ